MISVRQSVLLPTPGPAAPTVGPIVLTNKNIWAKQPQNSPKLNMSHPLIAGSTPLAIISGNSRHNLVTGKPLIRNGSVISTTYDTVVRGLGLSLYSVVLQGDATDWGVNADTGLDYSVDFWYGLWRSGSINNNQYLFGDYNGTTGGGLTTYHTGASGQWGYYDVTNGLQNSGESLVDNTLYCFVSVRKNTIGGRDIYRDGSVKITLATGASNQAPWAVGSIGQNQYGTFNTESYTLLAGRLKSIRWTAEQVLAFSKNPFQILTTNTPHLWGNI